MNSVLENYQYLSNITTRMRSAAMQGDWDQLVELEQQCSTHVEAMKHLDLAPLDESIRLQKVALINKILSDDAAIRDQTLPWMAKLQNLMQSSRSEQRLQQAYSGDY
ncbi:MAG: flagellar protein FliT [Gallionellaceae bacterium]|jgi:flagellar protein FliT